MFDGALEIEVLVSRAVIDCPTRQFTSKGKGGDGQRAVLSDVLTLSVPLRPGSQARHEVQQRYCPSLDKIEGFLDGQTKRGQVGQSDTIIRKDWGEQRATLYAVPSSDRKQDAQPVMVLQGSIKGKPRIVFRKDEMPVLVVELRGTIEAPNGTPTDQVRRNYVHTTLFGTLVGVQAGLPLGEAEQTELDAAAGVDDSAAPPTPDLSGDTKLGSVHSDLPEHTFSSAKVKAACAVMEALRTGWTWQCIQQNRARTGDKAGTPRLTKEDLQTAAAVLFLGIELKQALAEQG